MVATPAAGADPPLTVEAKIPLGEVRGRIDHLAVDLARGRLFVAELGNDSLGIIDIAARTVLHRVHNLSKPQGVAYSKSPDVVYVAGARDGAVRMFRGDDFAPAGSIPLGADADNIRLDPLHGRVYVGYGGGAIAVIDPLRAAKQADIRLPAHPEGFQLDPRSARIFVNVPEAQQITVVDRDLRRAVAAWPVPGLKGNFPMAIDGASGRVIVVFRNPARLVSLSQDDGAVAANVATCKDSDDVFVDDRRKRIYVICGEGFIDIFRNSRSGYDRVGRIATARGARTALFVPTLDRLFVAIRARRTGPAAIWIVRPNG